MMVIDVARKENGSDAPPPHYITSDNRGTYCTCKQTKWLEATDRARKHESMKVSPAF